MSSQRFTAEFKEVEFLSLTKVRASVIENFNGRR